MPATKITVPYLKKRLKVLDDGVLSYGGHTENSRKFCAIEFVNAEKHGEWVGDDNEAAGTPAFQDLNDAFGSGPEADLERTKYMLPVLVAYWNWHKWSETTHEKIEKRLAKALEVDNYATLTDIIEQVEGNWSLPQICKALVEAVGKK